MKRPLLLLFLLVVLSCHSSKLVLQKLDKYPMESTLFAEIRLDKKNLTDLLNEKIDLALQQSLSKGNIKMAASRAGDIVVAAKDQNLLYSLPINIDATMGTFAQATGSLILQFQSSYEFHPNWSLSTNTQVSGHQWIKEPKAEVFGISLSIEKLSNFALDHFGPKLAEAIDEQMKSFSDFKPQVQAYLDNASKPVLVDSVHNLWLSTSPSRFGIAPFFDSGNALLSSIFSTALFSIQYDEPATQSSELPQLEIQAYKKQKTHIHINGVFPSDSLTAILKQEMIGMTIPFGKKELKVEDIEMDFAGRLLTTRIKVSGTINGILNGTGAPYMNKEHSRFLLDDFDVKLTGSNMLMRSGVKLFRKKIEKTIEDTINAKIQSLSQAAIQKIQKEYASVGLNSIINLKIQPDKEIMFNFEIRNGSLYLQISLDGSVQINVNANG